MKLFSEYFAGHINHDFHLFGEDDMKFLRQFPAKLWERAIAQRYCVDLPKALLKREEARNRPLEGLNDAKGKQSKLTYYGLINSRQQVILGNLDNPRGNTEQETIRIQNNAHDNAKNSVDRFLSEREDGGGAWMNVTYPRTVYNFSRKHKHGVADEGSHTIRDNYIAELVTRLEGAKGSSDKGFDLSRIKNFNPDIPDHEQEGNWYTDGFTCPEKDTIVNNLQEWIGFSSQALLNDPRSIINQETHRRRARTPYLGSTGETVDIADKTIYKPSLVNFYKNYITNLKNMIGTEEGIDPQKLDFLRGKFNLMIETPLGTNYAYRYALNGNFPNILEAAIGDHEAHDFSDEQFTELIEMLVDVNNPLERRLSEALADIDLFSHKIKGYHGQIIDPEKGTKLTHPSEPNPHVAGDVIPEIHSGKFLFNIDVVKSKLNKKIDKAISEDNPEEAQELRNLMARLDRENAVGHHYNPREIAEKNKAGKRGRIFYQFAREEDIPDELDRRDLTLAGGIHPNKKFSLDVGARLTNLNNSLNNLMGYLNDPSNVFDQFVKEYIGANYNGPYNIMFKTFVSRDKRITNPQAYELFKTLIRDKALRNIGKFDLEGNKKAIYNQIEKTLRILTMELCQRLTEKNVGQAGTKHRRVGQLSAVEAVMARMEEMMHKTMRD